MKAVTTALPFFKDHF